tara:strand:- start:225 stop:476 length:252 start_codon:yes stop_codon:yes gene_type:complete
MKTREQFIIEVLDILNRFRGLKTGDRFSYVLVKLEDGQFAIGDCAHDDEEPRFMLQSGDLRFVHKCLNEFVEGQMQHYEMRGE